MKPKISATSLPWLRPFSTPLKPGQARRPRSTASSTPRRRPSFGDSNYFPAGWDRERLLTASTAELRGLQAGEFDKIRAGMIDKMGAEAFQRWVSLLPSSASSANTAQVQKGPATADEVDRPCLAVPDFVRTVQERYATGQWGFVVFRSTGYDMSQEAWEEVRKHIKATICAPFERHRDIDGFDGVAERFHLEWVQAKTFEGDVELVARRYGESLEQGSVPEGLRHPNFCLNVTPQALQSLGRYKQSDKDLQPFIQIVAPVSTDKEYEENQRQLAEELDETYPTRFNVALGSLLDGLLQIVGRQSLSLSELGGNLRDDEVWTSIS